MAASNPREIVWISFGILARIQSKWSLWRRVGASESEWATKCCKKHNHLHRMSSENISWNVTPKPGRVYQTTTKANRHNKQTNKQIKQKREETMLQPSNWRERHKKTDKTSEQESTSKQKQTAGGDTPVAVFPPHNGPRCERCVRVSRFCVWMYGPGAVGAELTSEISNFRRTSILDCATCAKSADEWVCLCAWESVRASACDWMEGVRQGWMWTHVESHHQNNERSVNTKVVWKSK